MEDKIHAISREVNTIGGTTTIYRAPSAVKQDTGIYPFPDESIKVLNEKIKNSFDPGNIFNPGRLISRRSCESREVAHGCAVNGPKDGNPVI